MVECSHGKRETLGSRPSRATFFFHPCDTKEMMIDHEISYPVILLMNCLKISTVGMQEAPPHKYNLVQMHRIP